MRTRFVVGIVLVASVLSAGTAAAQQPNQVTGLAVEQRDGYASLSWDAVGGATDYRLAAMTSRVSVENGAPSRSPWHFASSNPARVSMATSSVAV